MNVLPVPGWDHGEDAARASQGSVFGHQRGERCSTGTSTGLGGSLRLSPIPGHPQRWNAWGTMGGKKDDFFIYAKDGQRLKYLPFDGSVSTDLSTPEGYANIKKAVLAGL